MQWAGATWWLRADCEFHERCNADAALTFHVCEIWALIFHKQKNEKWDFYTLLETTVANQ